MLALTSKQQELAAALIAAASTNERLRAIIATLRREMEELQATSAPPTYSVKSDSYHVTNSVKRCLPTHTPRANALSLAQTRALTIAMHLLEFVLDSCLLEPHCRVVMSLLIVIVAMLLCALLSLLIAHSLLDL